MSYTFFIAVFSLPLALLFYRYILGLFFRLLNSLFHPRFKIGDVERDYTWQPMVSFTVPCFNEGEHIYHTIKSILAQDWPKEKIEVIVIDDLSADDSYAWALKAKELGSVTVMRNETNMGKRRSLILASKAARGEILVSVDSDVVVAPDALKKLVSYFAKNPDIGAVGGVIGISNANFNWITQTQEIKYFFAQQLFKATENVFQTVLCLSGCLTAYRREAIEELHETLWRRKILGSPIKYGEDRYLTHLMILNGWKTVLNFDAWCWTKSPVTLEHLFSQQLRWRRSNMVDWLLTLRTLKKHIMIFNPLILIGYFSLMFYILSYPFIVAYTWMSGLALQTIVLHSFVLVFFALIYQVSMLVQGKKGVNNPAVFIGLGLIFFVSYILITPLAIFTLDSTSWETRAKKEEQESEH